MIIKKCKGYELEKEKPNTSEDFFNRSEVTFIDNGVEKKFHLLYVRYFDEVISEFTPYESDPVFTLEGGVEITFKDIIGLICLLKNPGFRHRKRVYINTEKEIKEYVKGITFEKLPEIFKGISNGGYEVRSPLEFIEQPEVH